MTKFYKFKKVKNSVLLKFVKEIGTDGAGRKVWKMENKDYKGLMYAVYPEDLEEVK